MAALAALLETVFPPSCVACDAVLLHQRFFCDACAPLLLEVGPVHCARCAEPGLYPGQLCPRCRRSRPRFDRAFAPFEHEGAIARAIHRFKYEDRPELAGPLAELLWHTARSFLHDAPVKVCPIPLHQERYRERRYDQATLLANALCLRERRLTLTDALLTRVRATRRQVGLSDRQRHDNVRYAFEAQGSVDSVLLIDDVLTTGATAHAAARALKDAGVKRVEVLTLCRARRVLAH